MRARIAALKAEGRPLPPDLEVELIDPYEVSNAVVELITDETLAGRVMVLQGGRRPRLLPN